MKRRPLLILLYLFVACLSGLAWALWWQVSPRFIPLGDGSRLEFRGVTVGTNCSFDYSRTWQRLAARIPGKFGRKYTGAPFMSVTSGHQTNVVFWFLHCGGRLQTNWVPYGSPNKATQIVPSGEMLNPRQFSAVVHAARPPQLFLDLKDDESDGEPDYRPLWDEGPYNGETPVMFATPVVSQLAPELQLSIFIFEKSTGFKKLGEFRLSNPLYRKQP